MTEEIKEMIRNVSREGKANANVYRLFFGEGMYNDAFFSEEGRDIDYQGASKESLAFKNCIGGVFNICSPKFHEAFCAVINGEGQEKDKINTLHSSSLLGLLCFYKVSQDNPLEVALPFNCNDNERQVFNFTSVEFEKTNRVFSPSVGLSSIDIVLRGESNKKKVALYLESKFSEYLHMGKSVSSDSKEQYRPIYDHLKKNGYLGDLTVSFQNKKLYVNGKHYCQGIKQMISHTIGALNSNEENTDIYLAPIMYDFWNKKDGENKFKDYCKIYEQVSKGLIEIAGLPDFSDIFKNSVYKKGKPTLNIKGNKLFISNTVFSYQNFFSEYLIKGSKFELDQSVKDYYRL